MGRKVMAKGGGATDEVVTGCLGTRVCLEGHMMLFMGVGPCVFLGPFLCTEY